MAITNTDDHLRNHAFILTKEGWGLSPLYDVEMVICIRNSHIKNNSLPKLQKISLRRCSICFYKSNHLKITCSIRSRSSICFSAWATLRTLEEASRNFENDETGLSEKWLNQLIGPGSSLGGLIHKNTSPPIRRRIREQSKDIFSCRILPS